MRRRPIDTVATHAIPIFALLLLVSTACGGGDDSAEAPVETVTVTESPTSSVAEPEPSREPPASEPAGPTEESLEETALEYTRLFFAGDGAGAYEFLTQRCKDQTPLSEFAAIVETAAETYGQLDVTVTRVEVRGNSGLVDGDYGVPALEQEAQFAWMFADGRWMNDRCG